MREEGFEPSQALSHNVLSVARLTAPAFPRKNNTFHAYKKLYKYPKASVFACELIALAGRLISSCRLNFKMKSKTKIEKQSWKKNNPFLVETIRAAKKTGSDFWLQVAGILSGPRRSKTEINLNEIEKSTKEGDSVVFPGKILSQGEISKKIAVIAFGFSEKAREKLLKNKSHVLSILEEIKKNPEAKGLRILTR